MPEVLVISGKGGTGKTSLTGAFACLAGEKLVLCDLDVDAPDLHLILEPRPFRNEEFYSGVEAEIDPAGCDGCGTCAEMCRFEAISPRDDGTYWVDPLRCEGCSVCAHFCPTETISLKQPHCGRWHISETRVGPMVHAQLFPGQENSGKLVALLRQEARELAEEKGIGLILSDGPPGVGCPVISSLSGTHLAVGVTEPTLSGLHDLKRVLELCRHFKVPTMVVINKYDLNPEVSDQIEEFCRGEGIPLAGRIPFDPAFGEAIVQGKTAGEWLPPDKRRPLEDVWQAVRQHLRELEAGTKD